MIAGKSFRKKADFFRFLGDFPISLSNTLT